MTEKETNLVIVNTRASLVALPAVQSTDPKIAAGLKLAPGENDVPAWYWEKCLKIRGVKIWAASGILVDKGKGKAKPLTIGLDNLDRQDWFIKITKCDEVKILRDWMDRSEKAEIQKCCKDRIETLIKEQGKAA